MHKRGTVQGNTQYGQESPRGRAIPKVYHSSNQVEGFSPEEIKHSQLVLGGIAVGEGYEPKELTDEQADELRVVFSIMGMPFRIPSEDEETTRREDEYASLLEKAEKKKVEFRNNYQKELHKQHKLCSKCSDCACTRGTMIRYGICTTCRKKGITE